VYTDLPEEARSYGGEVRLTPVGTGPSTMDTFDVTFPGFGGEPVKAWLRLPGTATGSLPAVVQYVGHGGGRGHVLENLLWASAGYTHLQVDTRGPGLGLEPGRDLRLRPDRAGPEVPGVMTRGISSPRTYYYRRLLTEAVRAVDAVRRLDRVAPDRVAVVGQSQGGGTALAVAALVPDLAPRPLRRAAGRATSESLRTGSAPSGRTRTSAFRTDADSTR